MTNNEKFNFEKVEDVLISDNFNDKL